MFGGIRKCAHVHLEVCTRSLFSLNIRLTGAWCTVFFRAESAAMLGELQTLRSSEATRTQLLTQVRREGCEREISVLLASVQGLYSGKQFDCHK